MKKLIFGAMAFLCACQSIVGPEYAESEYVEPDYNYLASHINVVETSSSHVIYEYTNVRIDEVAGVAGVYCYEKNGKKQALLHKIVTRPDNRRHATFICQ